MQKTDFSSHPRCVPTGDYVQICCCFMFECLISSAVLCYVCPPKAAAASS